MPSGIGTALAITAIAGGTAAGAMGSHSSSNKTDTTGVDLNPLDALGGNNYNTASQASYDLRDFVNSGAGQSDVTNALNSQRALGQTYSDYANGGFMPNSADMNQASGFASQMFAPERMGLQQSLVDATTNANRGAAALGRSTDDPVLQAKLGTQYMNASNMLGAQQGAFGRQFAQQMPMQRLGFQQQAAQIQGGLASQALANRQALVGMGTGILNQERNWQYNTSNHWQTGNTQNNSGGGIGGALTGALGSMGAAGSVMGMFPGGGSSGGAGGGFSGATPAATMANVNSGAFSNSLSMPQMGSSFGGGPSGFSVM